MISETLSRDVPAGKIIHGDDLATLKVKLPAVMNEVRKLVEKTAALLSNSSPPDLVLDPSLRVSRCDPAARSDFQP